MTLDEAKNKLTQYDQMHVLKFFDKLSDAEKEELLTQIYETDFSGINGKKAGEGDERLITPIDVFSLSDIKSKKEEYEKEGLSLIKSGKAGAVLLAGGMGTRLGSNDPKGMYNMGLTRELYIFECLINNLMDVVRKAGCFIHLFVMTSDKNHEATVSFLKEKDYFGYPESFVHFFKQEMAPATDYEKHVFMESRSKIATSPNGNGGWFVSMERSGMLDIVKKEGIKWLNAFAVDNVLQRICDPTFLGAVVKGGYLSGSKVIRKVSPDERVGVMCKRGGVPSIVEYYELTDEMREAKLENGEYAYNFGVILNYLFNVDELIRIEGNKLPLHMVEKKIPHINEAGEFIDPVEPNGYKYESLILDMVEMFPNCLPYEVVREYEFAPVKNKTGNDSVDTARELLKKNGVIL